MVKSQEDMSFPGRSQAEGSLKVKTEMLVITDETALVETKGKEVVTIIKSEKIGRLREQGIMKLPYWVQRPRR